MTNIIPPSCDEFQKLNEELGFALLQEEYEQFYKDGFQNYSQSFNFVGALTDVNPPLVCPRDPGHAPLPHENPGNAWSWRCEIRADVSLENALLAGRSVAVKDSIAVAGVPMCHGSKILEKYVPEYDATVVSRVLQAGAVIVGKSTCEDLCISGSSITSCSGVVPHPHVAGHVCGGSSSGSAYLLATNQVDLALGGDQGGSIRIPSSWCGTVGLKPTYGLVPYTGACSGGFTIDHLGPMARNVRDVALLLSVIAGPDGQDSRQFKTPDSKHCYLTDLHGDLSRYKLGVLQEGFWNLDKDSDDHVRKFIKAVKQKGVDVKEVKVPVHKIASTIHSVVADIGFYESAVRTGGATLNTKGFGPSSLVKHGFEGLRTSAKDLSPNVKRIVMWCKYVEDKYGLEHFAKAQNIMRKMTDDYNKVLLEYDALLLPTMATRAHKLPTSDKPVFEYFSTTVGTTFNTAAFNATGHPALSINIGSVEQLPVGLSIIGKHFEDGKVLDIGFGFEKLIKSL